ncbi:MAG: hypothetical protein NT079_04225, partial [Candidatus Omnitrophica bacterium]|nr:hypothetical protein [Candidatus Omnitrophota bacterium]
VRDATRKADTHPKMTINDFTEIVKKHTGSSQIGNKEGAKEIDGGIDLNKVSSTLQINRDGSGMPLPLSQQPVEFRNLEGLTPFIINVTTFNPQAVLANLPK